MSYVDVTFQRARGTLYYNSRLTDRKDQNRRVCVWGAKEGRCGRDTLYNHKTTSPNRGEDEIERVRVRAICWVGGGYSHIVDAY